MSTRQISAQLSDPLRQAGETSTGALRRAEGWRRGVAPQFSNRGVACVAAIALTVGLAFYMGPDAIRYLKIRSM